MITKRRGGTMTTGGKTGEPARSPPPSTRPSQAASAKTWKTREFPIAIRLEKEEEEEVEEEEEELKAAEIMSFPRRRS